MEMRALRAARRAADAVLFPAALACVLLLGCAPSKMDRVEVTYYYMPG